MKYGLLDSDLRISLINRLAALLRLEWQARDISRHWRVKRGEIVPIERPHFGFDREQSEDVSAAVATILQALDTTGEGGIELETWKLVVAVSGQVVTKLAHRGENLTAYEHHLDERTLPDGRTVWALRITRKE